MARPRHLGRFSRTASSRGRGRDPATVLVLTLTVGWLAVLGVSWLGAELVASLPAREKIVLVDRSVAEWVASHRMDWLTAVLRVITTLGSAVVLVPLVVLCGVVLWRVRRQWQPLMLLGSAWIGAFALFSMVKFLVGRARPPGPLAAIQESGFAFPSGHTIQAVVVYGALVVVLVPSVRRRWQQVGVCLGLGLLTVLIGFSRIYLGVHWCSDVLAGAALGVLWLAVLTAAFLTIGGRSRR